MGTAKGPRPTVFDCGAGTGEALGKPKKAETERGATLDNRLDAAFGALGGLPSVGEGGWTVRAENAICPTGGLQATEEDETQMPGSAVAQWLNSSEFDADDRMAIGLHDELDLGHDEVEDDNIYDKRCRIAELRGHLKGVPPRVELAAGSAAPEPLGFLHQSSKYKRYDLDEALEQRQEPRAEEKAAAPRADLSKGVVFQPRKAGAKAATEDSSGVPRPQLQGPTRKRACSFEEEEEEAIAKPVVPASDEHSNVSEDTTFARRKGKRPKQYRKRSTSDDDDDTAGTPHAAAT